MIYIQMAKEKTDYEKKIIIITEEKKITYVVLFVFGPAFGFVLGGTDFGALDHVN